MATHTNNLIYETSPYLIQHAHNPVDWYPWNEEALEKAKKENKPILVSIGYSACHWCHVMERESFENEEIASLMNEYFVNIKIDREERPDLDHIYMDAVQAMTGSGGWPLNVFLTPDGKPFYGGTYFPPQPAFNRPSWKEILTAISKSFQERRHDIDVQAENMTEHIIQSNSFGLQKISDGSEQSSLFEKGKIDEAFQNIMKVADPEWGGFGKAPKFPQTFTIQFLLRYHYVTRPLFSAGESKDQLRLQRSDQGNVALRQACLSLDKMIEGGIYDQVGGGFARYSTDTEWLAPHFEKMLYDNALLVSVLSEAYQVTKKERYRQVIDETLAFVQRELQYAEGGFYSALDADSEGEEGKFYVWDYNEVLEFLNADSQLFSEYFDITPDGNWSEGTSSKEHKNILRVRKNPEQFASLKKISIEELNEIITRGKEILLRERNKRVRPLLDDKIILGWNALMNSACSKAFAATGNRAYKDLAISNMNFLFNKFKVHEAETFYHTWKNQGKHPAFLDDYAFLIEALLYLHEITADTDWLLKAEAITHQVIENFSENETGYFFYTHKKQEDIILRKKEVYDGALPSGNSIMAYNLFRLSILLDKREWKSRCYDMIVGLGKAITSHPTSFGTWACLFQELTCQTYEIAIIGKNHHALLYESLKEYIPHKVLMASALDDARFALLAGKPKTDSTLIYLCQNFSCKKAVTTVPELLYLISFEIGN